MLLLMAYVVDDIDEIAHVTTSSDKNERKVQSIGFSNEHCHHALFSRLNDGI